MRFTEFISEAGSPKQQAAIVIAMKKAGKKPKGVAEGYDPDGRPDWVPKARWDNWMKQGGFEYADSMAQAADPNRPKAQGLLQHIAKRTAQPQVQRTAQPQVQRTAQPQLKPQQTQTPSPLTPDQVKKSKEQYQQQQQAQNPPPTGFNRMDPNQPPPAPQPKRYNNANATDVNVKTPTAARPMTPPAPPALPPIMPRLKEQVVAEGTLNELSSDLLKRSAQAATDKRNQAMDPELHNALGGGYMNPLATHYDNVSQKMDNRAAQVRKKETIQKIASKIASPAVMRKIGMAEQGVAEEKKPEFMKAGNMKPFKVSGEEIPGAVHKLEKLLLKAKERDIELNYTNIDKMMQSVCKKHNLTGDELHNEFVEKHHMIPDDWIVKQLDEACWSTHKQVGMKNKGGKQVPNCVPKESIETTEQVLENLHKWFKEKWVRFGPDGKIRGDCARGSESEGKPKCLPQSKAHSLGKKGRASAAARKRREDPNANRSGKAINVSTKGKGK